MRSEDEIIEMIHKIHARILVMEDRLDKPAGEILSKDTLRITIHTLNQEICLLRWVLAPAGHQHSAGS